MPAMRLSRWTNLRLPPAPAVSDRTGSSKPNPGNNPGNGPKTPVRTNQQTGAPPSRTMRNGHGEGTVLLSRWVLESERERANRSPRIRSAVFNQSLPRCQALNHAIFRPASNQLRTMTCLRTRSAPTGIDFTAIKNVKAGPKTPNPLRLSHPPDLSRARFPARP